MTEPINVDIDKEIAELKGKVKELEAKKKIEQIKDMERGLTKLWVVEFPEIYDGYINEPKIYQVFGRKKDMPVNYADEWWEYKRTVTDKYWDTDTLGNIVFLEREEAVEKLNKVFKETHDEFIRILGMMDEINDSDTSA